MFVVCIHGVLETIGALLDHCRPGCRLLLLLLLCQVVGDETLAERFIESNETLRRGIMFSASLYL
jgi:hypothetical protein